MSSHGGIKKHHNTRNNNKSSKKLMKIINTDTKCNLQKITLTNEDCEILNDFTVNKKLDLMNMDTNATEMLFPLELNKNLREKVKTLTGENGRLQRMLEETEARLKTLEFKCPPAMHGRASDLAASKIVELSKKIRELTAELEVVKLRARNASSQPQQKVDKVDELEEKTKKSDSVLENEVKELQEKLNSTNLKLCDSRNQVQQLKHELKMTQKALTNEVGQNVSVQSVLSGKGWRGRAQQICGLQQRLNQLTEKLANHEQGTTTSTNDSISSIRQVERDLRAELTNELKESRKELEQIKNKWSAAKTRTRVLENDLSVSKDKVATLLEKTSHDDQLIGLLTNQLKTLTEKHKDEKHGIAKKSEQSIANLENEVSTEKMRNNQLQTVLQSREEQIVELKEKIKNLLKRMDSEGGFKSPLLDNNNGNQQNITTSVNDMSSQSNQDVLGQIAEAERARLLELIQVLNKRLDSQRMSTLQIEEDLRIERQKSAKLETKVARLELERVGAEKAQPTYSSLNRCQTTTENTASDKAKDRIELLEEKCAALKLRLQCVTQEKEDDIYHLTCLYEDAMRKTSQ